MVHAPHDEVATPVQNAPSFLPSRPQTAANAAMIVGLAGGALTALATGYSMFALSHRDPGLGWMVIGTLWALYGGTMAVLWFLSSTE